MQARPLGIPAYRGHVSESLLNHPLEKYSAKTALALVICVVAVSALPYLWAHLFPPPGLQFRGTFWAFWDLSQYVSAMRQAASNPSWTVYDQFTNEAHQPAFAFGLYILLGKLAGVTGLSTDFLYNAVFVGGRVALVAGLAAIAAVFLAQPRERLLAVVLGLIASGFYLWVMLLGALWGDPYPALVFSEAALAPEFVTFVAFFSYPHALLGLTLLLLALGSGRPDPSLGPGVLEVAGIARRLPTATGSHPSLWGCQRFGASLGRHTLDGAAATT